MWALKILALVISKVILFALVRAFVWPMSEWNWDDKFLFLPFSVMMVLVDCFISKWSLTKEKKE
jgi:hypothetical protein